MTNKAKKLMLAALIPAMAFTASAADKAPAKAAPAKNAPSAAKAAPQKKTKTLPELLSFLPATIATINGKALTKAEFIIWFAPQFQGQDLSRVPEKEFRQFVTLKAVPAFVDYNVILTKVLKDGYKPSADRVRKAMEEQLKKVPAAQLAQIEKQLGKKPEVLIREQSNQPVIQNYFMIREWEAKTVKPVVSDKEALDFYNKNTKSFSTPEMVEASHILIQPVKGKLDDKAAEKKAKEILAQLKKDGDFAKLAKENSSCPSKANGGKLGSFPRGSMVSEFEKAAFSLKAGELSGVVKTQFGYHIIKVTKKIPEAKMPYDKVKPDIVRYLTGKKANDQLKAIVEKAKKDYKVTVTKF